MKKASGSATRCCGTPETTANHSVFHSELRNQGSVIA
jgi:hypothetical protein